MYLLDTNVASEMRRSGSPKVDSNFQGWIDQVDLDQCYLAVITIMEIERGVINLERKDPQQGKVLRHWFETRILIEFDGRILPLDLEGARACAQMHVPHNRPENDAQLAAIAAVNGLTIVTRNTKDFAALGVALINPWDQLE